MATSRQNTSIKKAQPYKINTRSTIRDNMTDNKNFQNVSEHSDAQPGPSGSNDNVDLQQEIQAPVQDEPQEPVLNPAPEAFPIVANYRVPPNNNFKLPQFWKHNAEGWIALVQTKFRIYGFESQIDRYLAILEAFNTEDLERLYDIPNPEDPNCYDKLITQIRTVFARDQNERLELLLKDLTLGDRSPNELMRHLIVAAGTDNICSPQFEEILKDKFLKALPSDIAANSGNWNYTDLRTLANCATQAINANKRYGKSDNSVLVTTEEQLPPVDRHPNSYGPPKTFSQVPGNSFRSRSRFPNFRRTPDRLSRTSFARTAPFQRNRRGYGNRGFRNYYQYHQPRQRLVSQNDYVCYYHRRFHENAYHCEGPRCKFFKQSSRSVALNCQGRQSHTAN